MGEQSAPPQFELYDYRDGPLEVKNIANEQPEIRKSLEAILARHPDPAPSRPQSPPRE